MSPCEVCGQPATHRCSGLDVPALCFCLTCATRHEYTCPDVRQGAAKVEQFHDTLHDPQETA